MPVAFTSAANKAFAVVQRTFGEAAVVRPMTTVGGVNGEPAVDGARAVMTVAQAIFRAPVADVAERNDRRPWDSRTMERLSFGGAVMTVKLALADIVAEPQTGDLVERPATGEVFSVVAVTERTRVNVTLGLALADAAAP